MTDFITIEDLADFMDVDELVLLPAQLAVGAAQVTARRVSGQEITLHADDLEVRRGNGRGRIRLRQRPVREVTVVSVDGAEVSADTYGVLWGSQLTLLDGYFPRGSIVRITYTHGWDTEADVVSSDESMLVPADLKLAALSLAASLYVMRDEMLDSESIGSYSYSSSSAEQAMSTAQRETFEDYSIRVVPGATP